MNIFLGEYQQSVIGTRVAVPKKLREQISGDTFVLSKGFEKCLFGYPVEKWEKIADEQTGNSVSDAYSRDLKRYLYSGAAELQFDGQGRVVVPEALRTYAGLGEEVTVIGAGDHFEIWSSSTWRSHLTALEATLPSV